MSDKIQEENAPTKKKLLTLKRVVLSAFSISALLLVAFIVWENVNSKIYADSTVQAQQATQEMQRKGVSF